jgi:transcriptional regulator with XRE-family HTH domain
MLLWLIMNDIQTKLAELEGKNWTLAAISDELDVSYNTVQKWKSGDRYPPIAKLIIEKLDELLERKRIPKQRRYTKGSRVIK